MKLRLVIGFLLAAIFSLSVFAATKEDGSHIQPDNYYPRVKIETSMGDIIVELDRRKAPITVNNFLRYVDKRSYENTLIHRVDPNFVIQGGGYTPDYREKPSYGEIFNESGSGLKNDLHTISMARLNGPHTASRQFFFNMNDNESLDPGRSWGYSVFGMVVEGEAVLDAISEVETEYSIELNTTSVPVEQILIKKITVLPPVEY
ncbi:peptidylprolyl isomerase [Alteromonas sp. KUL49]|uniref:peptidylprolyl isomerase n=1 Tax=Alteromonas sp. KUL49 TaxID=2480798 RepID=UPI00102EEBE7|nr:peptidylprolyl isomerase [Alteromonas sp. KUL49]TAP38984.1 peptidyl-prolyl cis-trans isomerase [Alteromonas sp. KUL49]GEA12428.1 peptidyl-prolyl cis-trans isomerase [Alteromonas sp. KUL49]